MIEHKGKTRGMIQSWWLSTGESPPLTVMRLRSCQQAGGRRQRVRRLDLSHLFSVHENKYFWQECHSCFVIIQFIKIVTPASSSSLINEKWGLARIHADNTLVGSERYLCLTRVDQKQWRSLRRRVWMSWRRREKLRSLIVGGNRSSALKGNLKQSNSLLFDYARNLFSSILLIYIQNNAVLKSAMHCFRSCVIGCTISVFLLYSLLKLHSWRGFKTAGNCSVESYGELWFYINDSYHEEVLQNPEGGIVSL